MKYKKLEKTKVLKKKDYSKRIIFDVEDFGNSGHLLQQVTIPAKTKQRKHYHHKQTEVFYILEGKCNIYINDKVYGAKPGDSFICGPGDVHNLWNKMDKDFKLLVYKYNVSKEEDTDWEE